jgi:hypothetical protein
MRARERTDEAWPRYLLDASVDERSDAPPYRPRNQKPHRTTVTPFDEARVCVPVSQSVKIDKNAWDGYVGGYHCNNNVHHNWDTVGLCIH